MYMLVFAESGPTSGTSATRPVSCNLAAAMARVHGEPLCNLAAAALRVCMQFGNELHENFWYLPNRAVQKCFHTSHQTLHLSLPPGDRMCRDPLPAPHLTHRQPSYSSIRRGVLKTREAMKFLAVYRTNCKASRLRFRSRSRHAMPYPWTYPEPYLELPKPI